MNKSGCSLFYVRRRTSRHVVLIRTADYADGRWKPVPATGKEEPLEVPAKSVAEPAGSMCAYEWTDQDGAADLRLSGMPWTEAVAMDCDTTDEIRDLLLAGWKMDYPQDRPHDYLCFCRGRDAQRDCMYVTASDLTIYGGTGRFSRMANELRIGKVDLNAATCLCGSAAMPNNVRRFLTCSDAWTPDGLICLHGERNSSTELFERYRAMLLKKPDMQVGRGDLRAGFEPVEMPYVLPKRPESAPARKQDTETADPVRGETAAEQKALRVALTAAAGAWTDLCTDERTAWQCALFFAAAYACRQTLILTGESAHAAADAYSRTVCGTDCAVLSLRDDSDPVSAAEEVQNSPAQVVYFENGLECGYLRARKVMELIPSKRFVFGAYHREMLHTMPKSLFAVMLPVHTELFCVSESGGRFPDASCAEDLERAGCGLPDRGETAEHMERRRKLFGGLFTAPVLRRRCAAMERCIGRLCGLCGQNRELAEETSEAMLFAGLLAEIGGKDELLRILETENLFGEEQRDTLRSFLREN